VVKQLINQLLNRSNVVQDIKTEAVLIEQQQGDPLQYLTNKLLQSGVDTAYMGDLSRLLQICNNETYIKQFELDDVGRLLEKQVELQPNNLENHLEYGFFNFSVLDQNVIARQIVLEGINVAERKIKELKQLLAEIDKDESR
jgi:hypothetical protein